MNTEIKLTPLESAVIGGRLRKVLQAEKEKGVLLYFTESGELKAVTTPLTTKNKS